MKNCWEKSILEAAIDYINEPTHDECVRSLLRLAREIGGEGFDDVNDSDLTEITQTTKELIAEEILHDQKENEEDENEVLVLKACLKIRNYIKDCKFS